MSYQTQGASNRSIYDCCDYSQQLQQSVDPLQYNLYFGAQENCSKCIDKKAWFRQDKQVVDIESELWNITRPLSNCDQLKYNPNCETSPECISTFADNVPRILSPSLCPIVYNNIPIQTSPGYTVPDPNICTQDEYREVDNVDTYESYTKKNSGIIGNNNETQSIYMFLNSCSNKPLYQGMIKPVNQMMADGGIPYPWQMHQKVDSKRIPTGINCPMGGDIKNSYGGNRGNIQSDQIMYEPQNGEVIENQYSIDEQINYDEEINYEGEINYNESFPTMQPTMQPR